MEVEVRLFAGFRAGRFKNRTVSLAAGACLADLLRQLDIPEEEVPLPLVNGRYSKLDRQLGDNDVVSLFPAIGGG